MYIESILWMLSWPVVIIVSYQVIKLMVKRYEKIIEREHREFND
ncbi:MAG TPA: hypothetical protein VKA10_00205 [Prolixibacteraceae bacterium]|nr:hypothetical protein [Prolixibacteraceae bacterium]